jgi:competence protein ComEC
VIDPLLPRANMMGSNWRTATTTYGAGDRGTPRQRNVGKRGALTVTIIDAGNADAVYIENGSSRIMVDGGQGVTRIDNFIREKALDGGVLDYMFFSHSHADHFGGLQAFFKREHDVRVRFVYENQDATSSSSLLTLRDSVNARVQRGQTVLRDTDNPCGNGTAVCTIQLDGGARLHVMKPRPTGSVNNRSFAAKLVGPDSASFTMWLSGDAEHEALSYFEQAGYHTMPGMRVNVLKGNHHGSCNGITSRFLDLTRPQWVTFGVSATNSFGHVHTQTKELLRNRNIPWYRSDQNGRITIRTPGTVGGGYTVSVEKGSASQNGSGDATSAMSACNNL